MLTSLKSSTARAVANNTIFQILGKVFSMSVTILATVIITRMYGRGGYGEFNLMQGVPALFFIIVDFGLNAIATRELSKNFNNAAQYLGNILALRLMMSLFLGLFAVFVLRFFPYSADLKFGIYLSLFLILTQALYATTNIIFQVKLRYDLSTIGYVLGSVYILLSVLILSYLKVPIAWVNFSYVVGGFITFFANLYFIRRYIDLDIKLEMDPILMKFLLVQSLPLGMMFIFSQINFRADSLMLSVLKIPDFIKLTHNEVVAVYGLPYKVFEVALVVPTFFMNAAYPIFVRHMKEGPKKLKDTFYRSIGTLVVLGILAASAGIIFAPFAINVLGGGEFSQSVPVLRLLLVGLPVFYLSQPLSWLIVTLGDQKVLPAAYLASAVFNLGANLYFIPRYSFYASASITWISEALILGILVYLAYRSWHKNYA